MEGSRAVRHASLVFLIISTAVVVAGCGDAGSRDDGPNTTTVVITEDGYKPRRLKIDVGDRVMFINRSRTTQSAKDESGGDIDHSPNPGATAHDGSEINHASKRGFATHALFSGERQTVIFDVPHIYQYYSAFNPILDGTIEVVADAARAEGLTTSLRITRDFGREPLGAHSRMPLLGSETLLRQLEADHSVDAGTGALRGQFVTAIDGRRQSSEEGGNARTWVANVNGIETDIVPRDYGLYDGDVVQWDLRDWDMRLDVRATVGAFPATFTRGVFGERIPVSVACDEPTAAACREVKRVLRDAGASIRREARRKSLPPPGNPRRARILVGPWTHWRDGRWAKVMDAGPRYSGVFARFSPGADSLRLLDWNARLARSEGPGTGLVAAMRPTAEDLMWLVTGVDQLGVERAANALRRDVLQDAFAVAVTADGVEKLPLPPERSSSR